MTEPEHGALVGSFRNQWRNRIVRIYAHPTDATLVVTCGILLRPTPMQESQGVIWTTEPRDLYARYIGTFDKVYL